MPTAERLQTTSAAPRRAAFSRSEFAAHFESSAPRLWTIAYAVLGDRGLAEDALQEAAVVGLEKLSSFDPCTRFETWMATIVRFASLNLSRRRRGSPALDDAAIQSAWVEDAAAPPGANLGSALDGDAHGFDDEVVAALAALPPVARAVLLLRSVHALEYREISELLAIPEGTAMSHVHRARSALRERLRRHPAVFPAAGGTS